MLFFSSNMNLIFSVFLLSFSLNLVNSSKKNVLMVCSVVEDKLQLLKVLNIALGNHGEIASEDSKALYEASKESIKLDDMDSNMVSSNVVSETKNNETMKMENTLHLPVTLPDGNKSMSTIVILSGNGSKMLPSKNPPHNFTEFHMMEDPYYSDLSLEPTNCSETTSIMLLTSTQSPDIVESESMALVSNVSRYNQFFDENKNISEYNATKDEIYDVEETMFNNTFLNPINLMEESALNETIHSAQESVRNETTNSIVEKKSYENKLVLMEETATEFNMNRTERYIYKPPLSSFYYNDKRNIDIELAKYGLPSSGSIPVSNINRYPSPSKISRRYKMIKLIRPLNQVAPSKTKDTSDLKNYGLPNELEASNLYQHANTNQMQFMINKQGKTIPSTHQIHSTAKKPLLHTSSNLIKKVKLPSLKISQEDVYKSELEKYGHRGDSKGFSTINKIPNKSFSKVTNSVKQSTPKLIPQVISNQKLKKVLIKPFSTSSTQSHAKVKFVSLPKLKASVSKTSKLKLHGNPQKPLLHIPSNIIKVKLPPLKVAQKSFHKSELEKYGLPDDSKDFSNNVISSKHLSKIGDPIKKMNDRKPLLHTSSNLVTKIKLPSLKVVKRPIYKPEHGVSHLQIQKPKNVLLKSFSTSSFKINGNPPPYHQDDFGISNRLRYDGWEVDKARMSTYYHVEDKDSRIIDNKSRYSE